jgi:hypothetical protein
MRLALAAFLLVTAPTLAKEKGGVTMPDTVEAGGKSLKLNGMGIRMKFIVRVYVGGLYLENAAKDSAKLLAADEVRVMKLSLLMDLGKEKVNEAIVAGFEKNSKDQMPKLKDRLDKLTGGLKDVKKGEAITFTYVPGKGTNVKAPGTDVTVEGKDFADALFAVWLGKDPVDQGLKNGLLGED